MSFLKASKKKEDLEQSGGKYINKSGMYPVNIIATFVSTSKNGSESINFLVNHNGQDQVLYSNILVTKNNGEANETGHKVLNRLLVIADVDEVDEPVEADLPIGKNGADKEVMVLEDLSDIDAILQVQMEYSKYNGKITEKKTIRNFFRLEDKASAKEVVEESDFGTQYEKDLDYAQTVAYKDDLTPEEVNTFLSSKRSGAKSSGDTAKPKKLKFGKKK